jgi:hypothetical protein
MAFASFMLIDHGQDDDSDSGYKGPGEETDVFPECPFGSLLLAMGTLPG